jgi:hypothetical protein
MNNSVIEGVKGYHSQSGSNFKNSSSAARRGVPANYLNDNNSNDNFESEPEID